jgi:AAHS family 4-hydroxybenzoate transporter-like MFS transporter
LSQLQAERTFRVDAVIDAQPVCALQIRVVALCCLAAALNGFDGQIIGFLAPTIATDLKVDIRAFGLVFSAGFVGLMLGAMSVGSFGDRVGRKRALLFSMLIFGVFAMLTGLAQSFNDLVLLRFLTGVGLGGSLPNLAALATEYVPDRLRRIPASLIGAAIPTGAMSAGVIAAATLQSWGWRSMFYLGGMLPLTLAAVLYFALPESVRYLALNPSHRATVQAIMARIWPQAATLKAHFTGSPPNSVTEGSILDLFRASRGTITASLWIINIMSFMVLYFIISWMPALLEAVKLPARVGIMAITTFSLGGIVGSVAEGPLMNRFSAELVLFVEYSLFAALTGVLAISPMYPSVIALLSFGLGLSLQAAQAGLIILAVTLYPIEIRSTGTGWSVAVGITGSIIGPLLGQWALRAGWSSQQIFAASAYPALCAAAAVGVLVFTRKRI